VSGPKLDGHHFTEPCPTPGTASPRGFRVRKCLITAALGEHFAGLAAHQIGGVLEQFAV
jgi:hypothetical protein